MRSILFSALIALCLSFSIKAQETAPRAISNPDPAYPVETATRGFGGAVTVWIKIDKKGKVSVLRAAGPVAACSDLYGKLPHKIRAAAVEAAKGTVFEPVLKDGKPQDVELMITYRFDRDGKPVGPDADKPRPGSRIIAGGVLQGRVKHLAQPDYLASAKAIRAAGSVPVSVLVETDGKIIAASALGGHQSLQDAAVRAACGSSIEPVVLGGVPVQVTGILTYQFLPR